jgi:hypothetical protein
MRCVHGSRTRPRGSCRRRMRRSALLFSVFLTVETRLRPGPLPTTAGRNDPAGPASSSCHSRRASVPRAIPIEDRLASTWQSRLPTRDLILCGAWEAGRARMVRRLGDRSRRPMAYSDDLHRPSGHRHSVGIPCSFHFRSMNGRSHRQTD